ncbi:unnamed protein product [Urochloa decumbens]|uniref:F-box domain-containing protein n=1 Tax=Urochloa decumbens TaxID=240449 RepID=A0ABC9FLR8_9POAL
MAPPPTPSCHVPVLMDELLEEIFIRLPLDDPVVLFRAAIVCKSWCHLVSGPALCCRLLKFHGSPPLNGFFCRVGVKPFLFVPTSPSSLCRLSTGDAIPRWRPVGSLHCRVLIEEEDAAGLLDMHIDLAVWNPIGGEILRLPRAPLLRYRWNAALLCAAPGCDHLDCGYGGGHFLVVLAGTRLSDRLTSACVYSSEQRAWSKPISAQFHGFEINGGSSVSAIVGRNQELSLINLPNLDDVMIPTWELGVPISSSYLSAVAEHVGVLFINTCYGLFSMDLKSGLVTKVLVSNYIIRDVVPYVSFCTPASGSRAAFAGDQEPIASPLGAGSLI